MSNYKDTSGEAFAVVSKDLTKRQEKVLAIFKKISTPMTAVSAAHILGLELNSVAPRINELTYITHDLVIDSYTGGSGRKKARFRIRKPGEEKAERELSPSEKLRHLISELKEYEADIEKTFLKTTHEKTFKNVKKLMQEYGD